MRHLIMVENFLMTNGNNTDGKPSDNSFNDSSTNDNSGFKTSCPKTAWRDLYPTYDNQSMTDNQDKK